MCLSHTTFFSCNHQNNHVISRFILNDCIKLFDVVFISFTSSNLREIPLYNREKKRRRGEHIGDVGEEERRGEFNC
jgi:hypothetical protein